MVFLRGDLRYGPFQQHQHLTGMLVPKKGLPTKDRCGPAKDVMIYETNYMEKPSVGLFGFPFFGFLADSSPLVQFPPTSPYHGRSSFVRASERWSRVEVVGEQLR